MRGGTVQIAIELNAATGGSASQVEAVFDGDWQGPQVIGAITEGARRGFRTRSLGEGPLGILPQVRIVAGVRIGAIERLRCQFSRPHGSTGEYGAKTADGPRRRGHREIVRA